MEVLATFSDGFKSSYLCASCSFYITWIFLLIQPDGFSMWLETHDAPFLTHGGRRRLGASWYTTFFPFDFILLNSLLATKFNLYYLVDHSFTRCLASETGFRYLPIFWGPGNGMHVHFISLLNVDVLWHLYYLYMHMLLKQANMCTCYALVLLYFRMYSTKEYMYSVQ